MSDGLRNRSSGGGGYGSGGGTTAVAQNNASTSPTKSPTSRSRAQAKARDLKNKERITRPQLFINGEIECASTNRTNMRQLYCSFNFRFLHSKWWLISGDDTGGETFIADAEAGICTWNHGIDAHFA
jgi:hypothetical protein